MLTVWGFFPELGEWSGMQGEVVCAESTGVLLEVGMQHGN